MFSNQCDLNHIRLNFISIVTEPRKCGESSILSTRPEFISRLFSSGVLRSDILEDSQENDDLKSRIFRLRLPKRSATNVLQKWISEGNPIAISELRQISKELRKSQRYKHALEVRFLSWKSLIFLFIFYFSILCLFVWLRIKARTF